MYESAPNKTSYSVNVPYENYHAKLRQFPVRYFTETSRHIQDEVTDFHSNPVIPDEFIISQMGANYCSQLTLGLSIETVRKSQCSPGGLELPM